MKTGFHITDTTSLYCFWNDDKQSTEKLNTIKTNIIYFVEL